VTPAGIPPAAGRAAADDAAGALAGAGAVDVDDVPFEQAPSVTAAASNHAGRAREL